ncbi:MAG TPA: hypothetical protein VGE38_12715 [Nocardioides sp.]|uniref:TetR/AcrR family transcriptional regulator n=1 Tax=Nocardioides sp. TaxID=35761 RepID=UPI002ED92FA8
MTAPEATPRKRRSPEERRLEIASAAARIGLAEGLERITLRRVAEDVGVRPGLISHYFPEVDGLVATAFAHAAETERADMLAPDTTRPPDERVIALLDEVLSPASADFSRLWLNARIVSRYNALLRQSLAEQETLNRELLTALIRTGVETGDFVCASPERSALLILVLLDAASTYANEDVTEVTALVGALLFETAERELGLAPGALSARSAHLPPAAAPDPAS